MEDAFEKYLRQNRNSIENGLPSSGVWDKLQQGLIAHQTRRRRVIRIRCLCWSMAACLLLGFAIAISILKDRSVAPKLAAKDSKNNEDERMIGITDEKTRQSLYHYSDLIENSQKQIAVLRRVDPGLYAQSQKVLTDLNGVYIRLQQQLSGSPDQQKVLKALIQNLEMQEQILNNQLQLLEGLRTPDQTYGEKVSNI